MTCESHELSSAPAGGLKANRGFESTTVISLRGVTLGVKITELPISHQQEEGGAGGSVESRKISDEHENLIRYRRGIFSFYFETAE